MDIVWSYYNVCPPAVKRIIWERRELESEHPEYKVFFDDRAPMTFIAFIIGPDDSIYQHKLLKFRIDIPFNYPNEPPKVTYVQYRSFLIHPDLNPDGDVCLPILDTTPTRGQSWRAEFRVHTVLIWLWTLLDNEPFHIRPRTARRDRRNYNQFVRVMTWRVLLFDHFQNEDSEPAKRFLISFAQERIEKMIRQAHAEWKAHKDGTFFLSPDPDPRDTAVVDWGNLFRDFGHLLHSIPRWVANHRSGEVET